MIEWVSTSKEEWLMWVKKAKEELFSQLKNVWLSKSEKDGLSECVSRRKNHWVSE